MQETYSTLIEKIRNGFPSPVSDAQHDVYVIASIIRVLNRIDAMKGKAPFLGEVTENDYERARNSGINDDPMTLEEVLDYLLPYFNGVDVWAHPLQHMNVVPPVAIPAVIANLLTGMFNPNITWDEWSRKFSEVEVEVAALVSEIVGYDKAHSIGISTYGGSGANLYGVKMMLAKTLPGSGENGVREDVKIIASEAAHSSKFNALDWLGLGKKNLVLVPTDEDNCMLPIEMKDIVYQILDRGEKLGGFICTMGTTDAFGVDDIRFIHGLRDHIVEKYNLGYKPHIHCDAVIGWAYAVFNDYDFDKNPLDFSQPTLKCLYDTYISMEELSLADSIGIDFHKTGYTQYVSSLFLLKEKTDLDFISRSKDAIPYLFQAGGHRPGLYTLELSRSASGMFSALANLRFLGKDGFRVLLAHPIEMAVLLREKLENEKSTVLLNKYNYGPVTLFRCYPGNIDGKHQYYNEYNNPEWEGELTKHNEFNKMIYFKIREKSRKGECAALSITDKYRDNSYGKPVSALKSFIMTPFVTRETIEELIIQILEIKKEVEAEL